jgi:hypothetical protein
MNALAANEHGWRVAQSFSQETTPPGAAAVTDSHRLLVAITFDYDVHAEPMPSLLRPR